MFHTGNTFPLALSNLLNDPETSRIERFILMEVRTYVRFGCGCVFADGREHHGR
jgi:hypothetical protein